MGRTTNEVVKPERIQIRVSANERIKLEEARIRFRPRMQFQEFLLELMDLGLEIEEIEYESRRTHIEARKKEETGRWVSNE